MNDELPKGWVWTSLEKCIEVLDNQRNPINAEEREKRINDKDQSKLFPYYGATGQVGWIDDYIFDEELILLGEDGAPFLDFSKDKAYLIRGRSWVNNHAHVLRAIKDISVNSFICHYLNTFDYHNYITGTTRYKLNQSQMRKIMIPVPPLAEQQRIVNKIEELFTNLDKGVESLNLVKYKLKIYRQAILKYAMEGKLTEKWREENKEEDNLFVYKSEKLNLSLPNSWNRTSLENCVDILDNLRVPVNAEERQKRIQSKEESELYPYYGATGQVGWIDDYIFDEELILLGEDGAPFLDFTKDKAYPIKGKSWINNHAHVLRAIENIAINSFICHYLNTFDYRNYITGTTRYKLNQAQMRKIMVSLPPLEEQNIIVERIEQLFSLANYIEETVDSKLEQSKKLRQSILKKAFEGKLVPQDPNDEPAEILLERIKIEKSNKGKAIQEK